MRRRTDSTEDCSVSIETEVRRLRVTLLAAEEALRELPPNHQALLPNALLILAVQSMIEREGANTVAGVLGRLAHAVQAGPAPPPERALDLSALHS
jgi:hypothetical protein